MQRKQKAYQSGVVYWVVIREEETKKLFNKYMCGTLKEAEAKKIEQEEARDPEGKVCEVSIESIRPVNPSSAVEVPA